MGTQNLFIFHHPSHAIVRNPYGHGFSLLELLIALAIASILLCFSLPAWTNFQDSLHAKLITEKIISSLNFARLQAVLNNRIIQFKPINNHFKNGWEILDNHKPIKIYHLNSSHIKITTEQFSRNNIITFQPNGTTEGSNGNFKINNTYKITLNRGGRIYWEILHSSDPSVGAKLISPLRNEKRYFADDYQ